MANFLPDYRQPDFTGPRTFWEKSSKPRRTLPPFSKATQV